METKLGHLESYSHSLNEIKRILKRDGAIDYLFPNIKSGKISKKEADDLNVLFLEIKEVFELISNNTDGIDDVCKVTSSLGLPILYDTQENILLSYTVIIRYFIEYLIVKNEGFYNALFSKHVAFIKNNRLLFYFLDETIKRQLYYVSLEYTGYLLGVMVNGLTERVSSLEMEKNKFNDIANDINTKHSDCVRIEDKIISYEIEIEKKYSALSDKIQKELTAREEKVQELKKYLENVATNYNFAGLTKAYSDFYKSKNRERWISLFILFALAISSFLPISIKLLTETAGKLNDVNLVQYIGFSALTIIALYFFRVSLQNYNSIKAELTQIKLRMNLCMFVDNYSDFSKNKDNREALEKFESIIFSNIQPNENNIPSTFDGLEQLASVIESITKRNK